MATTTIQIKSRTKDKLARLKSGTRQTYDELVNLLLAMVPEGDGEGRYTEEFRLGLIRAELDSRAGRVTDHQTVKKRLGLK